MASSNPCLVYEAVGRIEIFSAPCSEVGFETGRFFVPGDLVSVDFVKEPVKCWEGADTRGSYLRLSDGSGWVCLASPASSKKKNLQPVPVEEGVWTFFVDNFPDGMKLCNHPIDELQWQWQNLLLEQIPKTTLQPMHKVYCDRRVTGRNGVNFYRLQHSPAQTTTWVFDKRRRHDGDRQHTMMMPEGQVQHGIFAFRAIQVLKLRMYPLANKRNLTGISVAPNDVIVCDIIRGEKYYRMIDGSGWIFATQDDMVQVGIEPGTWAFRVTTPYGVKLQTQPEDDRSTFGDPIQHNETIVCDGKLTAQVGSHTYGRTFYHVQATNGWVSDMGRDRRVMERTAADQAISTQPGDGWTEGFVRGVSIASMAGVTELSHHPESNLISFQHPSGANLQVFYATRTVGITEHGRPQVFCRNCSNPELVEIFKSPAQHMAATQQKNGGAMEQDDDDALTQDDPEALLQQEVQVRNQLLSIDHDFRRLQSRKDDIWKKVAEHQERRDAKENHVQKLWSAHMKLRLEEEEKLKKEEEQKQAGASSSDVSAERCHVYRVIHDIGVRSAPNVDARYRTDQSFARGDLVSMDRVLDFQSANGSGPFLRLSDGSGWLFQRDTQGTVMEEIEVQTGLWHFYVGNEPNGIGLRKHPMDKLQDGSPGFLFAEETSLNFLKPFQRVSCDRKIVGDNGVHFYRLQGKPKTTWIMDKRFTPEGKTEVLLHPASQVRTGMFAFEAIDEIGIRRQASTAKKYETKKGVAINEIVVADLIFEKDYTNRDGPFLRLADGSGWLFVNIEGDKVMKDIPIKTGKWKFRISHPNGLRLRKQPVDKVVADQAGMPEYKENQVVVCDREIKGSNGMSWYYRPVGRDGWLPNLRGKFKFMTEEEIDHNEEESAAWTVDLVRGVALATVGMEEIEHNSTTQVISFQSSQGATIKVHYTTRNIETTQGEEGQTQLRSNCSKHELVGIFQDPVEDVGRRPSKRRRTSQASAVTVKSEEELNAEDDYRNRLLQLDKEEEEIKQQREALWKSIRELEKQQEDDSPSAAAGRAAPAPGTSSEQLNCPTCHKVFGSLYAKQMHVESLGH